MPNFPISFDSDSSLYLAVNNKKTFLASGIDNTTLTIPVLSTTGFPAVGFVSIPVGDDLTQTEAIKYTSLNSATFFATQRGADGTPASAHNAGSEVGHYVVAAHHNELKDAVVALEYYVGVSGGGENFLRVNDNGNVTITGSLTGTTGSFSGNVSGASPTTAGHLATKAYVDGAQKAIIGAGITSIVSGTNTITVRSIPNAIVGGSNITVFSGTNTTTITAAQPPAIIAGTDITVTSGTNTITVASTAAANANKPIVGDSFIGVVTGTNSINLSADAIISQSTNLTVTSGASTVGLKVAIPSAIIAGTDIQVTSGTNTITITSLAAANVNKAIIGDAFVSVVTGTSTINLSADAIISGSSNITVVSGTNTLTIDLSANPSVTSITATTVTGTTGRFAGALSSQTFDATTITAVTGTITRLGGTTATFLGTVRATTVTGVTGQFSDTVFVESLNASTTITGANVFAGGTMSAQIGTFSTSLSVSGIPVQLQAVTSGAGGIVTSANGLSGALTFAGTDGNTVTTAGISTINVNGFRNEFISASGSLQSQISSTQSQVTNTVLPNLPTKGTKTFLTPTVDRAGGERRINESFNNRCLVRKLKVTPTVTSVNSYVIQFFTKNTFSFDDLLEYEATASGVYADNELWFHEDADLTSQFHLSITNTSNFDSTFTVELKFEKFF